MACTATVTNATPSDAVVAYQWDLDGTTGFEATTTTNTRTSGPQGAQGLFTAQVKVTTAAARSATGTTTFVVTAATPTTPDLAVTLVCTPASVVVAVGTINCTATATNQQAGETIAAYEWDLDTTSGFEDTTTTNTHSGGPYATRGFFTATVKVLSSTGRMATGTFAFAVTN